MNCHYQVPLPQKTGRPLLPDNRATVHRRRQFDINTFKMMYVTAMNDNINKGCTELVQKWEQSKTCGNVWYLPHHKVLKHKEVAKHRIVLDCATVFEGTSLNKQLNIGSAFVKQPLRSRLISQQHRCHLPNLLQNEHFEKKLNLFEYEEISKRLQRTISIL